MELLKVYAIIVVILIVVLSAIFRVIKHLVQAVVQAQDAGIETYHHASRWGYRFTEPYGGTVARGGFRTEQGALRAAQRERALVALGLEEAMGL